MPATTYDIHGLVRIRSELPIPMLKGFIDERGGAGKADIVISPSERPLGTEPQTRTVAYGFEKETDTLLVYIRRVGNIRANFSISGMQSPGAQIVIKAYVKESQRIGFVPDYLKLETIIECLLGLKLLHNGYVVLHASSFADSMGANVIVAASDTGKTSTLLRMLASGSGAKLVSDDSVLADKEGDILSFPSDTRIHSGNFEIIKKILPDFKPPSSHGMKRRVWGVLPILVDQDVTVNLFEVVQHVNKAKIGNIYLLEKSSTFGVEKLDKARAVRKFIGSKKTHPEWHSHQFVQAYSELNLDFDYRGLMEKEWSILDLVAERASGVYLLKGTKEDFWRGILEVKGELSRRGSV